MKTWTFWKIEAGQGIDKKVIIGLGSKYSNITYRHNVQQ